MFRHPLDSRLELIRGHLPRSKNDIRPRVVFRPVAGENPAFLLQRAKDRRSRKRREAANRGHIHPRQFEELQRAFKNSDVVVVKTKDQTGLDGDAGVVKFLDAVQVSPGLVEGLARLPQAGRRDGFQADEERLTTARGGKLNEIIVIHDVEGGLAGPPLAQRNQAAEKLAGVIQVADDIEQADTLYTSGSVTGSFVLETSGSNYL